MSPTLAASRKKAMRKDIVQDRYIDLLTTPPEAFIMPAAHHKDHAGGFTGPYDFPDDGVVFLYHATDRDPLAFLGQGLAYESKHPLYAHQAPARYESVRFTLEFEANLLAGQMTPAGFRQGPERWVAEPGPWGYYQTEDIRDPALLYENPASNAIRLDGMTWYGMWVVGTAGIDPLAIRIIHDNWTAEVMYHRDRGGLMLGTFSSRFPAGTPFEPIFLEGFDHYRQAHKARRHSTTGMEP